MNGTRRISRAASATRALRACAMPEEEIRAVVEAEDAETVRRHVELHVERLQERLIRQRRILLDVERMLAGRHAGSDTLTG